MLTFSLFITRVPRDVPENYRPISFTSVISKILEHIVYSSISNFLEEHAILMPRQHGFRPNRSCTTQLILAIDDWAKSLDHGYRIDTAIFDFSKAFDSVPHKKLLAKIQAYGIRGTTLRWIDSFIGGRRQQVSLSGVQSSWLPVA